MTSSPRFEREHSGRASGWDVPADLEKAPATIPDATTTPVPEDLRREIEARMALYPDSRSATLPALEAAQRVHGWCSPEAIEQVACVMGLTPAYLDAVATFYDMLETEPVGRHAIYVCTNISCSLCGADELYEVVRDAAADDPAEFNVRAFECLGACDIAPMASVDGVYVGPLTTADVPQLLEDIRAGRPVLPEKQLAHRQVADPHANTREFPEHAVAHIARAGAANPDIAPERAGLGPSMDEDRAGPSTSRESQSPAKDDSGAPHEDPAAVHEREGE
jgi:NADH-quinone oxidoreductase subunit E